MWGGSLGEGLREFPKPIVLCHKTKHRREKKVGVGKVLHWLTHSPVQWTVLTKVRKTRLHAGFLLCGRNPVPAASQVC